MILLLSGEDQYHARRRLHAMREQFRKTRDSSGLNEHILHIPEASVDNIREAVFASPFLADRKLVVIHNIFTLSASAQQDLLTAFTNKPDSTVVMVCEGSLSKTAEKSPLYAYLSKQPYSETYPTLTPATARGLIAETAKEAGVTIDPQAMQCIIDRIGLDSWMLATETEALAAHAKANEQTAITVDTVQYLTIGNREESIFAFLDSAIRGNATDAINRIEALTESGTEAMHILTMLTKQIQTMLGAKDLMEKGMQDSKEVAKILGVHPFPTQKAMKAAERLTKQRLIALHDTVITIEHRLKTGATIPMADITTLIVSMSTT